MHQGFRLPQAWASVNESIAAHLQLGENLQARVYQGIGHALVETTLGLAKLYPLKKKIHYFKNLDPYFDEALMALAKEGYKMFPIEESVFLTPADWVAQLEREDLFVLYGCDDPLLGRYYDVRAFEAALAEHPIARIRVSHARHFFDGAVVPAKNGIHLYSLTPQRALAVLGERLRPAPLVAPQLSWGNEPLTLTWYNTPAQSVAGTVENFEQSRPGGCRPYFAPQSLRAPDRVVVYWEDMDGHAFIDRLAQRLGITLRPPGEEQRLETTSLSRWGGVRTMDFLKARGLIANQIRGLVIMDADFLRDSQIGKMFFEIRTAVLRDQNGE